MNEQHFEAYYKTHYKGFMAFAMQLLPDVELCRDILSDAFESAWSRCDTLNDTEMSSFIFSIVRNKCADHFRHLDVHERYVDYVINQTDVAEEAVDVGSDSYQCEKETFRETFKTLTPRTQQIFTECYLNKRTYQDVADELNISSSSIKKHIMQALAAFRAAIKIKRE